MTIRALRVKVAMVILSYFVIGCSLAEQNTEKTPPVSFITTPASYYSTAKARYLGEKYKDNLDQLAERIVRNPKTAALQFANNISSVGGIGFFTHSATTTVDERYLEVIVSAPDTFDRKEAFNDKVSRIFVSYGAELLAILAGDPAIYQEKEVSGYGLNLTWRSIVEGSTGSRIVPESAVMYFPKETVSAFLHQDMAQNMFLARAVIFAAEGNAPMTLISYRQPDSRRDTRLPIHEEALTEPPIEANAEPRRLSEPRIEAARETTPPIAAASDKRSTSNAPDIAMIAASRQSADGAGKEQVANNQPTQPARTVKATMATKIAERTSVTKRGNDQFDLHKAEQPGTISLGSKPEALHQTKPERGERKIASAERSASANLARGGDITKDVTTSKPWPQRAVSKSAEKSGDEKKAAPVFKTTTDDQASPVKAAQSEAKKKSEALPTEQAALARKDSVADSRETPRQATRASATHGGRLDTAKPLSNPVAKNQARNDSLNGQTVAAAPVITDVGKLTRAKNREAVVVAKSAVKSPSLAPGPATVKAKENLLQPGAKLPKEQLALLKSEPSETEPENRVIARARPKALEGYIIQVGFNNKNDAQRWAKTLERRGYAVSVTEADGAGPVRLRLGNFSVREEAERQLQSLKREGLAGIVINLPQAYRPAMGVPASEASQTARKNN